MKIPSFLVRLGIFVYNINAHFSLPWPRPPNVLLPFYVGWAFCWYNYIMKYKIHIQIECQSCNGLGRNLETFEVCPECNGNGHKDFFLPVEEDENGFIRNTANPK